VNCDLCLHVLLCNRGLDKISAGFRESIMSSVDGGVYDAINAMRSDLANKANQHRLLAEQLLTEVTNHDELKHYCC
jgi:hypothetical protein